MLTNTDLMSYPERLLFLLKKLQVILQEGGTKRSGLSQPQDRLLILVLENPGSSIIEIANKLQVKPPSASAAVNRMVQRGLLSRKTAPDDKRRKNVFLTEDGAKIAQTLLNNARQIISNLLSGLTEAEQEQVVKLLEHMITEAEDTRSQQRVSN